MREHQRLLDSLLHRDVGECERDDLVKHVAELHREDVEDAEGENDVALLLAPHGHSARRVEQRMADLLERHARSPQRLLEVVILQRRSLIHKAEGLAPALVDAQNAIGLHVLTHA